MLQLIWDTRSDLFKNAFVKSAVVIGAQNERFAEVTSGLLPGVEVVTRGAYSLAFAGKGRVSLKQAMDAAHGHPHKEEGSEMTKEDIAAAAAGAGSHARGGGKSFTPLTMFFAGSTGLLLVLLLAALRWKTAGGQP